MTSASLSRPSTGGALGIKSRRSTPTPRRNGVYPLGAASVASTVVTPGEEQTQPPRLPEASDKLPFTLSDIRRAIPRHCFKRSALKSFSYLIGDLAAIAGLVSLSTFIDALPVMAIVKWGILWPAYWYWVSAFGVGVWIIGHECGHGAFSENERLNDFVGFFCHSFVMVPYFSWKHSHRKHHANTGSITKDEAFVPTVMEEVQNPDEYVDMYKPNAALPRGIAVTLMLVFGFPLYLMMNLGGREYKGWPNHFNPWSPVFQPRERWSVLLSDVGLLAMIGILTVVGMHHGLGTVIKTYIVPYFVVHMWLVLITFLHHTSPECPHYDDQEWTFLKGAISTIDRDFGFLNVVFHRITDTHVLHHLFCQIPHYHALEATEAIKPVLGDYYKSDSRSLWRALWEDFKDTKYVAPDKTGEGVLWYRG